MSMTQNEVNAVGATTIPVGLSAIIKIQAGAYQNGFALKILSGGGTLEISKPPIALSGTSATGWATGYPLGALETFSINGPATFYLAATGATMVASMTIAYTSGASVLAV